MTNIRKLEGRLTMFKQLFGKYLVEQKALTPEQYAELSAQQAATRVKLGLIAVEEKLLTKELP